MQNQLVSFPFLIVHFGSDLFQSLKKSITSGKNSDQIVKGTVINVDDNESIDVNWTFISDAIGDNDNFSFWRPKIMGSKYSQFISIGDLTYSTVQNSAYYSKNLVQEIYAIFVYDDPQYTLTPNASMITNTHIVHSSGNKNPTTTVVEFTDPKQIYVALGHFAAKNNLPPTFIDIRLVNSKYVNSLSSNPYNNFIWNGHDFRHNAPATAWTMSQYQNSRTQTFQVNTLGLNHDRTIPVAPSGPFYFIMDPITKGICCQDSSQFGIEKCGDFSGSGLDCDGFMQEWCASGICSKQNNPSNCIGSYKSNLCSCYNSDKEVPHCEDATCRANGYKFQNLDGINMTLNNCSSLCNGPLQNNVYSGCTPQIGIPSGLDSSNLNTSFYNNQSTRCNLGSYVEENISRIKSKTGKNQYSYLLGFNLKQFCANNNTDFGELLEKTVTVDNTFDSINKDISLLQKDFPDVAIVWIYIPEYNIEWSYWNQPGANGSNGSNGSNGGTTNGGTTNGGTTNGGTTNGGTTNGSNGGTFPPNTKESITQKIEDYFKMHKIFIIGGVVLFVVLIIIVILLAQLGK